MANRVMLPLALLLIAVSIALSVLTVARLAGVSAHNCHQIDLLKGAINSTLVAGERVLGRKGSAGYEYYHTHPLELANAKAQIRAEIRTFSHKTCN